MGNKPIIYNYKKMSDTVLTMAKNKSKSVIIDGDVHNKFKDFCKERSLKIGGVIEDLIQVYLDEPKTVQKLIDESKEKK